ncbi:MAG TPA: phosphatase PAP2 family protein [Verrucomicrobiae bacterium]|jgi:membrane-associated phospholipid phosphatase|nr:phosphatase PAP2 family protein [Verrucomicrobiae bacterium]
MVYSGRFKSYSLAAILCLLPLPAAASVWQHAPVSDLTAENVSSGINPDYALPDYPALDCSSESSSSNAAAPASFPLPAPSKDNPGADREVSLRKLPMTFLHDQKDMWLFPVELGQGRHWLPALFITGGTAVFIASDPQTMPHFRQTTDFHGFNRVFSTTGTGAAIAVVPAVFYSLSLLRHDSYDQGSALFAGEAVADDAILMVVMKAIARRARPTEFPVTGPYNDTFFHSNASFFGKGTSFPSGHALMAFSVATVFARRYREHRWVPYLAYAAASAIAFSRITTGAHFPSDVFVGSALGFVIARYDVLHGQ